MTSNFTVNIPKLHHPAMSCGTSLVAGFHVYLIFAPITIPIVNEMEVLITYVQISISLTSQHQIDQPTTIIK